MLRRHRFGHRAAAIIVASSSLAAVVAPAMAAPPANDNCTSPTTIQLGQTPFTTVDATSAGPGVCVAFGKDVWFKHRAKFTAKLLISTCDAANFDTVIAVYRGTSCNDQTLINNMIGCADESSGCGDNTTKLTVNVTKDQVYLIRVGGFNADSGTGVLTLSCGDAESAACADIVKDGASGSNLGISLGRGGLMNADNFADQLVGAYLDATNGADAGAAFAYQGDDLSTLYSKFGEAAGDKLGNAVATGDVNNDGRLDIIIGAPFNDEVAGNAGKVYVYNGFNGNLLWSAVGQAAGDRFGQAVGFAGDVNNDGFGDVIVGAPYNDGNGSNSGRAYVLDGENGSRLKTHTGSAAGDLFGFAVAGVGDLNDDDFDDYAVGEPKYDNGNANDTGRVSIYKGNNGKILVRILGDAAGDQFGYAIAAQEFTATFDYTFILIGAPFNDFGASNAGRARIYFRNHDNPNEGGCANVVCLRYTFNGANANGRLGAAVSLGDLVGNSAADAIVGAPYTAANGNNSGAVYIFDGNGGALSARFFGETAGDRFGTSVAFAGDIDNDGNNDLMVGGPFNDSNGTNAGRAYAFLIGNNSTSRVAAPQVAFGDAGLPVTVDTSKVIGDATLDGVVNTDDVLAVVSAWGPCPVAAIACNADVNRDGRVDVDDLLLVVASMPPQASK